MKKNQCSLERHPRSKPPEIFSRPRHCTRDAADLRRIRSHENKPCRADPSAETKPSSRPSDSSRRTERRPTIAVQTLRRRTRARCPRRGRKTTCAVNATCDVRSVRIKRHAARLMKRKPRPKVNKGAAARKRSNRLRRRAQRPTSRTRQTSARARGRFAFLIRLLKTSARTRDRGL